MMFINKSADELNFMLDSFGPFVVAPGATVDIPDKVAFCIKERGIELHHYTPKPAPALTADSTPAPKSQGK